MCLRRAVALYKYLDGGESSEKDGKGEIVSITRDNTIVKDIVLP